MRLAILGLLLATSAPVGAVSIITPSNGLLFVQGSFDFVSANSGTDMSTTRPVVDPYSVGGGPRPPPVPEPATWSMLIVGFASLGLALRRRRPAAHAA
jgi:hypothetical protein